MKPIIIPKSMFRFGDLVIIPKKEYENLQKVGRLAKKYLGAKKHKK